MTELSTLQTWLAQAEAARHQLLTGSLVEQLQHGDQNTRFTRTDIEKLDTYIASLKSQIAGLDGTAIQRRRPINLTY